MKRTTGRTRLILLALLGTALMAPAAWGASYYVAATGSNSGTGGSTSPWQTLSYACGKAVSGDTITVNAGAYTDNSVCTLKTGVSILGAGKSLVTINTTASPYISATSSLPVVTGGNQITGISFAGSGSNTAISSQARSNQSIHDCGFNNFGNAIDIAGKTSTFSSSCTTSPPTATASYCDDKETLSVEPGSTDWATGIQIYGNSIVNAKIFPNTIKDSFIHDNVIDNSTSLKSAVGNTSRWWSNVQFYNNTIKMQTNAWKTIALEVWMVENDTKFYSNWTNGWFSILKNPTGPSTPYSWEIVNNTFASNVVTGVGSTAVGQALETCYFAQNVLIAGNYFTNTGTNNTYNMAIGIHGKGWAKNYTIRNNVFYNIYGDAVAIDSTDTSGVPYAASGINVYNNVFDTLKNGSSQGVYMQDGAGTINGVNIRNNIFTGAAHGALIYPSGNDVQNVVFTNNIVTGGNYTYNYGTAATVANGGFTSVTGNYNLVPDFNATGTRPQPYYGPKSNAANFIDKGVNVGLPYTGTAPDIGAFEYLLTPYPPSGVGIGP